MSFTQSIAFLGTLVGGLIAAGPVAAGDKDDAAITAFVAHLGKNGIKVEYDRTNWWAVTEPKTDGYKVIVAMIAFPPGTSEKAMKADLQTRNLAFILNAPTRLAMSYPGLEVSQPGLRPPKLEDIPVAAKMEKLFKEYQPALKK